MKRTPGLAPGLALAVLAILAIACDDPGARPSPSGGPQLSGPAVQPSPTPARPGRPVEPLARIEAAGRSPLELSASALPGHPPLPTYRASVRNATDQPVGRVIATVVYLDANGKALPGENHDVAFGSPQQSIDPGVTFDTMFLSRVDTASETRLVAKVVTFLEKGPGGEPVPREWKNPHYEEELKAAEGRR